MQDQKLPAVVIVGRPNVGKSTLFNRLTRSRSAIVADVPGLTRDRHYGRGRLGDRPYIVIDTGGFEPVAREGIAAEMARQTRQAVVEADCVVFLVDARAGVQPRDHEIAAELRRTASRVLLAVNKAEGMPQEHVSAEFHELGLGVPLPISAAHGEGVRDLVDEIVPPPPPRDPNAELDDPAVRTEREAHAGPRRLKVAVVGRPNAGKSTLINTLLGEERMIAFDQPGTTRDSVEVEFERGGRPYSLIDTAGLRRRAKVTDVVEKFSVVKTLQAIEDSNVCVLVLDAAQDIAEQDASIAGYVLETGRAVVLAVNKWDLLDEAQRTRVKLDLDRKLHFLRFARLHFISALKGRGVNVLMQAVDAAYAAAMMKLPTPKLTRALQQAVERQAPPRRGPIRPKLRYAHQGGQNPPIVIIHGNALDAINDTYRRYLETWFREQFGLQGTPLRVEFRGTTNPYATDEKR